MLKVLFPAIVLAGLLGYLFYQLHRRRAAAFERQAVAKRFPLWRDAANLTVNNFRKRLLLGEEAKIVAAEYERSLEAGSVRAYSSEPFTRLEYTFLNEKLGRVVGEAAYINRLSATDSEEAAQEQEVFVNDLAYYMALASWRDPNWYPVEEWVAYSTRKTLREA